jgi:hypothetical protein
LTSKADSSVSLQVSKQWLWDAWTHPQHSQHCGAWTWVSGQLLKWRVLHATQGVSVNSHWRKLQVVAGSRYTRTLFLFLVDLSNVWFSTKSVDRYIWLLILAENPKND